MAKELIMYDHVSLETPAIYSDTLNLLEDMYSHNGAANAPTLAANIRATHSGYLCNNRVYPGVHMRDSVGSWTSKSQGGTASFNKPVLIHHRQSDGGGLFSTGIPAEDPIGRVMQAAFTQLKEGQDFVSDFRTPAHGTDLGSGHINLGAMISDPGAIQKILDGRYDSVSVGFNTAEALCSVCGDDWLSDSKKSDDESCDHRPGRTYEIDGKNYKCFLVTGIMNYNEVSYVNNPASPNARTLSNNLNALESAMSGDSSTPFESFSNDGSVLSLAIRDSEGHHLELVMEDGQKDELPDLAAKMIQRTIVAMPEVAIDDKKEDGNMAKDNKETKVQDDVTTPTDKADSVISDWVKDNDKKVQDTKSDDTKDQKTDDVKDNDQKDDVKDDDKAGLDKALATALNAVTDERDELKTELKASKSALDAKVSLCNELTDEISELKATRTKDLSRQLAVININLQRPGTLSIGGSSEKFDKYVDSLATRSDDSLTDSITDALPELDLLVRNRGNAQSTNTDVKVDDPTIQGKDQTNNSNVDVDEKSKAMSVDDYLDSL
jgi:hypothetical protein